MRLRPASDRAVVQSIRMKIVHVIPALTKGGAERVVIDLANAAVSNGHEVAIIVAAEAPPECRPGKLRPEVQSCVINSRSSVRGAYPKLIPWIVRNRRWLLGQDVVHCHLTFGAAFGAVLQLIRSLSRDGGPAIVETYHAIGMAITNRARALHSVLMTGRDAIALMAEDPYWQDYAQSRPNQLFRTIPNGISPPPSSGRAGSQHFRAAKTGIPTRPRAVVGSVSRLVPARRPDLLLDVFANVAAALGPDVHFLLAGEGPEWKSLESQSRRLGLERQVHLPGLSLDPSESIGLMDLYLTVNVGSITGIAAIEAAFLGVPVIALQLRRDYAPSETDWIWSSTETEAIAARAAELLGDPDGLCALAQKQQAHAKANHDVEGMAEAYDRLYAIALASARRSTADPERLQRTLDADRER